MDVRMDRWMGRWMDGWMDGLMDADGFVIRRWWQGPRKVTLGVCDYDENVDGAGGATGVRSVNEMLVSRAPFIASCKFRHCY